MTVVMTSPRFVVPERGLRRLAAALEHRSSLVRGLCQLPEGRCEETMHAADMTITVTVGERVSERQACEAGMHAMPYWALLDWVAGPLWRQAFAPAQLTIGRLGAHSVRDEDVVSFSDD